jgi:hypothetical protein
MPIFNAYLMVDWSAGKKPKQGKDSIWYCLVTRDEGKLAVKACANPPTRQHAISDIGDHLAELHRQGMSTLVGFDFAYGYPSGFAKALGLSGGAQWTLVWDYLRKKVKDGPNNENNRFEVAAATNERLSGGEFPYWGCPAGINLNNLKSTKPKRPNNIPLAEFRLTEIQAKKSRHPPKSVWQIMFAGAVGSQALLAQLPQFEK